MLFLWLAWAALKQWRVNPRFRMLFILLWHWHCFENVTYFNLCKSPLCRLQMRIAVIVGLWLQGGKKIEEELQKWTSVWKISTPSMPAACLQPSSLCWTGQNSLTLISSCWKRSLCRRLHVCPWFSSVRQGERECWNSGSGWEIAPSNTSQTRGNPPGLKVPPQPKQDFDEEKQNKSEQEENEFK